MFAIVTATINMERARPQLESWLQGPTPRRLYVVMQGTMFPSWSWDIPEHAVVAIHTPNILGVVPAFNLGVQRALEDGADIIACLHDDLLIEEAEQATWVERVQRLFQACPLAGLCGFGGAQGLGSDDIYQSAYSPMQLVRQRFISNMRHAEAHGERWDMAGRLAVLDGFSQIGLRSFWQGTPRGEERAGRTHPNLFAQLEQAGVVHHAYDAALGAFAKQLGYQVWFLPIRVHHYGGQTAVADPRYHHWATFHIEPVENAMGEGMVTGDAAAWTRAHRAVYDLFPGVLPIRC